MAAANAPLKDSTFKWEGRDRKGTVVKGVSEGPSEAAIKLQLRKQGINPTRVNKQLSLFGKQKKPIKGQDISVFSRQLATMMAAGVPLVQSLEIVGRGHANPTMGEMVMGIKATIEGGATLAESLAKMLGSRLIHFVPRDNEVQRAELAGVVAVIALAAIGWGSMLALVTFVEPEQREMTQVVPAQKLTGK